MREATMLYKYPGPYEIHGGNYDYIIVDADESGAIETALAEGWFKTTPEAKAAFKAPSEVVNTSPAPIKSKATKAW